MTAEQLDILIKTARVMIERKDTSEYSANVREVARIALEQLLQLLGNSEQVKSQGSPNSSPDHIPDATKMVNSPVVPDGWVMVPIDPTSDMADAYYEESLAPISRLSKSGYKAMLAAAPRKGE